MIKKMLRSSRYSHRYRGKIYCCDNNRTLPDVTLREAIGPAEFMGPAALCHNQK